MFHTPVLFNNEKPDNLSKGSVDPLKWPTTSTSELQQMTRDLLASW